MLLTLEFPMQPLRPLTKLKAEQGDSIHYHFGPENSQGRKLKEVLGVWRSGGAAMVQSCPQQPLTWMRCMAENLAFIKSLTRSTGEMVLLNKGNSLAIVDAKDPDPVVLQQLGV